MGTPRRELSSTDRLVLTAKEAGVPRDTLERFLSAGYVPQPRQLLFHGACRSADGRDAAKDVGYGGALGGGKTHCAFSQIAIDDCQRFPNLKVLFLRKVGKYARESLEDLRRSILQGVNHDFKNNIIHYPNESRIIIGSYQYEKDIDNYLSLEYDIILIEQAEQLSGKKIDLIATRNRSSKGFRPRMYFTFNPGGLAHAYLKNKFITPFRKDEETTTRFIFANYQDNAFLDPEYKTTLDSLTGWQKAAWRDGDWDIAAGQFFTNWRHNAHTCKPFDIPQHWPVWAALDYGFTHPTASYLFTENDGTIYVIAEYVKAKRLPNQNAEGIIDTFKGRNVLIPRLRQFVAGDDVFAKKGDSQGKTIAEQYKENGISLTRAVMDRINGAARILKLLGDPANKIEPRIKIFDTCVRLIECLPAMQHDPHRPEDVLKVDVDEDGKGGDDAYDALRYGLMANRPPTKGRAQSRSYSEFS